jgi:hypothetical protein
MTWVKQKLLNFKKKGNDEKPFTFSCNVGYICEHSHPQWNLYMFETPSYPRISFSQKTRKLV